MLSHDIGDSRPGTMQLQATHPDLADSAKRFRHHPQRPQDIKVWNLCPGAARDVADLPSSKTKPWVLRTTTVSMALQGILSMF